MANYTSNYNLYKPNIADTDIDVAPPLETNFETIDTEIKNRKDEIDSHVGSTAAHDSENITHGNGSVKDSLFDLGDKTTWLDERIDNIVTNVGDSNSEVVDARLGNDGSARPTLGDYVRELESNLAERAKKTAGRRSITDWDNLVIDKGLPTEDWKDAFAAARNFLNSSILVDTLIFPTGIYQYSVSPNWAIQNIKIYAEGEVRLRYTGTSHAVILDGSGNDAPVASNVFNMEFRGFLIESGSTSIDCVYVHAVHHSKIEVRVLGGIIAGLHVYFAVCTEFWITVSGNEEGWYLNNKPFVGILLEQMASGQLPSYCIFHNPIIEGTVQGAIFNATLGNTVIGGTMEGCLDTGLSLSAEAGLNKFYNCDFEANTGNDVTCNGFENHFYSIDSTKMVDVGATAKNNSIVGGSFKSITLESGSQMNLLDGLVYNRELYDGTTGIINDVGTNNRIINCRDMKNGTWHA